MREEITENKLELSTGRSRSNSRDAWWNSKHVFETTSEVLKSLPVSAVDAAFEADCLAADVAQLNPAQLIQGLSGQLAMLEAQCAQLRQLIDQADSAN